MQSKIFTKAKGSLIAVASIILLGSMFLMTACTPSVTPSSPGIATITPTFTSTPITPTVWNANAGDIAFVGISTTDNQFAFVVAASAGMPAGASVVFTNYPWDNTLNGGNGGFNLSASTATRGAVTFTAPALLPQWSEFCVTNATTPAGVSINQAGGVTVGLAASALSGAFTLNNGEDQIYAYQGSLANPSIIIGATAVYTFSTNFEPGVWNLTGTATSNTAPALEAGLQANGGWGYLPSSLSGGAGTTIAFNGNNDANSKGYFEWTYQCGDTSGNEAGLISSINSNGGGVTVYEPTQTNFTSLAAYTGTTANGVSILLGNSQGVSASGGSTGQIMGTGTAVGEICNEPHSPKTSGYTTW